MNRNFLGSLVVVTLIGLGISYFALEGDTLVFKPDFSWTTSLVGYSVLAMIVERLTSIFIRNETERVNTLEDTARVQRRRLFDVDQRIATGLGTRSIDADLQLQTATVGALQTAQTSAETANKIRSQKMLIIALMIGILIASFGFRLFDQACHFKSEKPVTEKVDPAPDGPNPGQGASTNSNDINAFTSIPPKHIAFMFLDIVLTGVFLSGGTTFIDAILRSLRPSPA